MLYLSLLNQRSKNSRTTFSRSILDRVYFNINSIYNGTQDTRHETEEATRATRVKPGHLGQKSPCDSALHHYVGEWSVQEPDARFTAAAGEGIESESVGVG